MGNQKRLAIIGNGRRANIVVEAYKEGLLDEYTITGIFGRTEKMTVALAEKAGCKACNSIDELLIDEPEYVAEAASVSAIHKYAADVLKTGIQLVVLSIGAFADENYYTDG